VTLAGQNAFQMASAGGLTGEHRAWLTQDALDNALVAASDTSPAAVRVCRENGAITLTLDGRKFATVDAKSAEDAGTTVAALADTWAQSVRDFLSDQNRASTYIGTLKNENRIQANIAMTERTFYAPAGLTFPITLNEGITPATCKIGDAVEGTIQKDVMMGGYAIPAGTIVIGELSAGKADEPESFSIRFSSLRTATGTIMPIDAVCLAEAIVSSEGPHRVCTYAIPSGMANGIPQVAARIPAGIGIGALETDGRNLLVLNKTTGGLVVGSAVSVQFETPSRVAVIMRQSM
jgi:hypothetical protein